MPEQQVRSDPSIEFLATCARALARADDLDDVLEDLVQATLARTDALAGAVFLLDDERRELVLAVGVGLTNGAPATGGPERAAAEPDLPGPEGVEAGNRRYAVSLASDDPLAIAVREGRVVGTSADASDAAGAAGNLLLRLAAAEAGLSLPLQVVRDGIDTTIGALGLCWASATPDDETTTIASAVADFAATAVDRARALSATAERADWHDRLAHTDPLTGLANRRTFDRVLELELTRAGRQGSGVTIAVFDVDEFAETNRVEGRPAGDEVLRVVASVLAESVRLVDTVARYGADEFVVVAPGSAGTVVAERVLETLRRLPATGAAAISVSAGVATFPADGTSSDELLGVALQALRSARAQAGGGSIGTAAPAET